MSLAFWERTQNLQHLHVLNNDLLNTTTYLKVKEILTKYSLPGQERFFILKLISLSPKLRYKKQPIIPSET